MSAIGVEDPFQGAEQPSCFFSNFDSLLENQNQELTFCLSGKVTSDRHLGAQHALSYEAIGLSDGWNLLATYEMTDVAPVQEYLSKTYTWGTDLSGSMQGAGGVGGLLGARDVTTAALYTYTYDANGNVSELIDNTGAIAAHYEYGPFGELIVESETGLGSWDNPFQFSTKYTDETGLVYYGYRYYESETGRWLSKDPIGERGGINLYGMVDNDSINAVDPFGLNPFIAFVWECAKSITKDFIQDKIGKTADSAAIVKNEIPNACRNGLSPYRVRLPERYSSLVEDFSFIKSIAACAISKGRNRGIGKIKENFKDLPEEQVKKLAEEAQKELVELMKALETGDTSVRYVINWSKTSDCCRLDWSYDVVVKVLPEVGDTFEFVETLTSGKLTYDKAKFAVRSACGLKKCYKED